MKRLANCLVLLCLPVVAGCSSFNRPSMPDFSSWVSPYRIDVRQGNYLSQEMVSQLKKGMTKDQVRYALGTPLLKDMFHANRWDYVYTFATGKGDKEERKVTVFFDADGRLLSVAGDVVPMSDKEGGTVTAQKLIEIPGSAPAAASEAAKAAAQ